MNPELLAEYKITHIVSILQGHSSTGPHHLTISLDDSHFENLLIHFPRVCDFIDEAVAGGGVVFVHCQMGISRSASCVIAYGEHPVSSTFRSNLGFLCRGTMNSYWTVLQ